MRIGVRTDLVYQVSMSARFTELLKPPLTGGYYRSVIRCSGRVIMEHDPISGNTRPWLSQRLLARKIVGHDGAVEAWPVRKQ
ncbi:hypothetical protein NDU88_006477 [Pleurodeles waltl]|uniref:Uncharacterized protein n=1 Tax=Pleurodeles waltl TaxID=8319 RepID=A0AAV7QL86_PLEWA|nr:hypothetical protein NDU88_006477 [Pleurodeles waltl]